MEIISKRTRVNNKFYDGNYDLDIRPSPRIKKPKNKKPPNKFPDNFNDPKRGFKNPEPMEDLTLDNSDKNTSTIKSDVSSPSVTNRNSNFNEKTNNTFSLPKESMSYPNATLKFHDQQFLNRIMNLSSINSESHKQYEVENLEFFKKLLEEKFDNTSLEDNRLISNLPNDLIVNNPDHQFLYPWIDMIIPNYSKPYCTNLRMEKDDKSNEESEPVDSSLTNVENSTGRILYLTENQMFQIINCVLEQIVNTPQDNPVTIDWKEVSKVSNLSQEVCKDFWWSFDKTHIRGIVTTDLSKYSDELGGCFFSGDWYHYYKVDEWYFVDLKHRVQCLIRLADECRLEREKILNDFINNPT